MKYLTTIVVAILWVACSSTNSIDEQLLIGQWKGASWDIEGTEKGRNASVVSFEFLTNQTYKAIYGEQTENGVYRVQYGKLYTTENGKAEKNVGIDLLTKDSLVLNMNRVGTIETLTLIKVK